MSSAPRTRAGVRVLWPPEGGYAVKLTKTVQTNDFEAVAPVDEQMDELERRRLLYVAATRARDHLVVSLHRRPPGKGVATNAQLLHGAGAADSAAGAVAFAGWEVPTAPGSAAAAVTAPPDWETWFGRIAAARAASRRPGAVTASGLEGTEPRIPDTGSTVEGPDPPADEDEVAGTAKGPRDLELPPWSKGRYGTAVGRAVHAVLQSIDLQADPADGRGVDDAVAAQCVAEGVVGHAAVVKALVASALASPVVRRAATRRPWRESWVATVETADPVQVAGPARSEDPAPSADPARSEDSVRSADASGSAEPLTLFDLNPASGDASGIALDERDGAASDTVLEGIIDLMYREDDGSVVIVDYKTDAIPAAALPIRAAYYTPQIRAYARAVRAATGATVSGTLLFLHPERPAVAIEVEV